MAAELSLVKGRKADRRTVLAEIRLEQLAGLDEFAADAEEAYGLLEGLNARKLPRDVIDFRYRKALRLIARAGVRARAAEAELRGLSGDIA